MKQRVWIVGRNKGGGAWDFRGVFCTEAAALRACRDQTYFVGPALMDEEIQNETQPEWPGAYCPGETQPALPS